MTWGIYVMRKYCFRLFTVAASVLILLNASSAIQAQDVLKACETDIKTYCSKVTLGDGRLLACMYAHEDKLSEQCDVAVADAADQLDWFLSSVREAIATCAPDIEKHCADVAAGQGRIYACLRIKKDEIGDDCKAVVDEVTARLTQE
jgi:Cysteine rich repeat